MLINAFLLKIHDRHPIGKKLRHVGVHYTEWVKKFVLWNLDQATNGTSGNKLIAL